MLDDTDWQSSSVGLCANCIVANCQSTNRHFKLIHLNLSFPDSLYLLTCQHSNYWLNIFSWHVYPAFYDSLHSPDTYTQHFIDSLYSPDMSTQHFSTLYILWYCCTAFLETLYLYIFTYSLHSLDIAQTCSVFSACHRKYPFLITPDLDPFRPVIVKFYNIYWNV